MRNTEPNTPGSGASPGSGVSRRAVLRAGTVAGAAGAAATALAGRAAAAAPVTATATATDRPAAASRAGQPRRLALVNGRIHTVDAGGSLVSAVLIEDGRILQTGDHLAALGPDVQAIDLQGRTAVPGFIEAHIHFVSLGLRPGYHVVIENARGIADVQAMLAARRPDVPPGEFITAMGGWHPNMFAEHRLPTLAELDDAVPDRPVLVYQQFNGPCATNTLGRQFLQGAPNPVVVSDTGAIAGGLQSTTALYNLRVRQTLADKKRSTIDAMSYAAGVGLTTVNDQVGLVSPGPLTPTQNLANFDQFRMYDAWLAVHRDGDALIRLQANFLHNQNDINLPELTQRLKNQFEIFGDDLMMTGAIGEWGAPGDGSGAVWMQAQRLIAQARWRNVNRALSRTAEENEVAGYEAVNAEFDITDLRWRIDHVLTITDAQLDRLKQIGVGVQMGTFSFVSGNGTAVGAPFRRILDNGIRSGLHQDGVHIAPCSPWFGVYYATTGVNALGNLINDSQQITRPEALRAFTRDNAWFLNKEDDLGSIEPGKLADLAVLDRDYLTVPDADLKHLRSVLTVVGGRIVHDTGELTARTN